MCPAKPPMPFNERQGVGVEGGGLGSLHPGALSLGWAHILYDAGPYDSQAYISAEQGSNHQKGVLTPLDLPAPSVAGQTSRLRGSEVRKG